MTRKLTKTIRFTRLLISLTNDDKHYLKQQKEEGYSMAFVMRQALRLYREQKKG